MTRSRAWTAATLAVAAAMAAPASGATPSCRDLLSDAPSVAPGSTIGAAALVGLRDFGELAGPVDTPPSFAVSPDGRFAALELRRADPTVNGYCIGLVVVPLAGGPPRLLATGGDLIRDNAANRAMGDFPRGWPRVTPPAWSPDGRSIAWLRRFDGRTNVWTIDARGTDARQITQAADDVRALAWTADGRSIVFETQPAVRTAWAAIDREGRSGWSYDNRFWPVAADHPWPTAPFPSLCQAVSAETMIVRPASADECKLPEKVDDVLPTQAPPGDGAWLSPVDPDTMIPTWRLHVRQGEREIPVPPILQGRIVGLWWVNRRHSLLVLSQGGVETGDRLTLFRWTPDAASRLRPIFATDDLLQGCAVLHDRDLLCAREGATTPRHLDRIDGGSGEARTLFDPNPDFAAYRLGPVRRLVWRNAFGRPAFGDLVLPPDHQPGQKHPLLIVQYSSRGFLRGGTGDEYPVQLFADHGFAVLSFDRPPDVASNSGARTTGEWEKIDFTDWADRRNVEASLEAGIALVERMGVVDPARIGVTGLSEGATTAVWALDNTRLFAAASLSSCCETPDDFHDIGPVFRDQIVASGYPRPAQDDRAFWDRYSIAANAAHIPPLLLQLASTEFRGALAPLDALQVARRPVDMLVFPDEYHVKWQPAHRLAIYRRNVCWFEYWFTQPSPDVCDPQDLSRWDALPRPQSGH
jgi:dipeptidyl aminopeptidase/acylaminoacyl peptidase